MAEKNRRHGHLVKSRLGILGGFWSLGNFVWHFVRHLVVKVRIVVFFLLEVIFFHEFAMEEVELPLPLVGGKRGEDHGDGAAVEARWLVHLSHGFEVLDDPIEHHETEVFVGVFAAAELEHEAAFVVALKESFGATKLDVVVVLASADAEFDFLHPGGAFGFLFFEFRLLVFVFPVIDDLADRRIHLAGDLDEIEAERLGFGEGIAGTHDSELLAVTGDDADFRGADAVVDPRHIAETTPGLIFLWLSDGSVLQWVDATRRDVSSRSRHTKSVRRGMRNDGRHARS